MAKELTIELTIDPDGNIPQAEALGFSGCGCTTDLNKVLKGLGAQNQTKKREFHDKRVEVNRTRQDG